MTDAIAAARHKVSSFRVLNFMATSRIHTLLGARVGITCCWNCALLESPPRYATDRIRHAFTQDRLLRSWRRAALHQPDVTSTGISGTGISSESGWGHRPTRRNLELWTFRITSGQ